MVRGHLALQGRLQSVLKRAVNCLFYTYERKTHFLDRNTCLRFLLDNDINERMATKTKNVFDPKVVADVWAWL